MNDKKVYKKVLLHFAFLCIFVLTACSTVSRNPLHDKQKISTQEYEWREWSRWPIIETAGIPISQKNDNSNVIAYCTYNMKNSISCHICNYSSDTIYVFRTYMSSEFNVFSNNFWNYDKKSRCTYLSFLPWKGMLTGPRSVQHDLLKSAEHALYSPRYLHYTFYSIPPHYMFETKLKVWNIVDDKAFQKKNKHFSLKKAVLQIAYFKDVDLLVENDAMYLKSKEWHEQELAYNVLECDIKLATRDY